MPITRYSRRVARGLYNERRTVRSQTAADAQGNHFIRFFPVRLLQPFKGMFLLAYECELFRHEAPVEVGALSSPLVKFDHAIYRRLVTRLFVDGLDFG